MLVALYAPVIDRKHLFCTALSTWLRVLGLLVLVPFGECYTDAPYTIAGHTTAVQTCLALLNVASHVETVNLVRAIV